MKSVLKFLDKYLTAFIVLGVLFVIALLAFFATPNENGSRTYNGNDPTYSDATEQAYCEAKASNEAAIAGFTGVDVPQDASSGCEPTDLPQMGALAYYKVAMATPTEFYNSVNGKGFNEGYGMQCVAGFKEFMFSLSGKYVATSTGGASGYAKQQAQIEPLGFKWYNGKSGLQDGDWGIFTMGTYGHVAMYYQGKWFGQNQYAADPNVGNAFNLASISTDTLAGYYRPNIYIKSTGGGDSGNGNSGNNGGTVTPPATSNSYTVRRGDTLGGIALKQGWYGSTGGLYGDAGYAQRVADYNNIQVRGLIYPNQVIRKPE